MSEEMKPCRRCGLYVSPDGIEVTQTDTGTYIARFECPDCGEVADTCMRHPSEDSAIADVIDNWNSRWVDPALIARIEELERKANAALIAAAPEMYEALADIAQNCGNHGCSETCAEADCKICKILKKARGEA